MSGAADTASLRLAGETLVLLPEHAIWWPAERALLVADAHYGKAASFRRSGVPVPHGTTASSLDRLSALMQRHDARQVIFLGDFLHAARGRVPALLNALARWRERHADVALRLVRGNHDDHAGDPPPEWRFDVVDEPWTVRGVALCHHPRPDPQGAYVLAGHLHPCVHVAGGARDRLRLPCYWFGSRVGVLPAFGAFTGMQAIAQAPGDRVYAVAGDRVVALPGG